MNRFGAVALALALSAAPPAMAQNMFGPGMHAVKMAVDDFQKTTQFYGALGMKPGATYGATRELVWESGSKNSAIMMAGPSYGGRKDIVRGGNYLMIVTPDIKAAADRLTRAGFPVGKIGGGPRASILMVKDPDGNHIELMGPPLPK